MIEASPTFGSARLRMRPLVPEDAIALHPLYADREAATYGAHPAHDSFAQTEERLAGIIVAAGDDARTWAITLAGDDAAIGYLCCWERRQGGVVEIGYALARSHWGRGIAREAVAALVDALFAGGARRVFADTDPDNRPSIALLEALGFQLEGRLRAEWHTHIGVRDSLIWGLLAGEWRR